MIRDWLLVDEMLSQIEVLSNTDNKPVSIHGNSDELKCIGVGTDAAVFQYVHTPSYALKLYAEDKRDKIQTEAKVYQELSGSSFFSKCITARERYLVLSYESGITLYDCLLQGIPISPQVIQDVEDARSYARNRNLNPRDIHLKNVLLQNGRAKIIDVSEYLQPGNDYRWEHLKRAYHTFYPLIEGNAVPQWILESIKRRYNQRNVEANVEFIQDVSKIRIK